MFKFKKMESALILALIACILFHLLSFGICCNAVKRDVLRLHILANSDSEEDQALKIKVRDAVLDYAKEAFENASDLQQAREWVLAHMQSIVQTADNAVQKNGFDYPVQAALADVYFTTRHYDSFTLPAGEYEALQIRIGKAQGHNWWCVMFPALCLAASDNVENLESLSEEEKRLIFSDPKIEVRFKCVEMYENIKNYLKKGM